MKNFIFLYFLLFTSGAYAHCPMSYPQANLCSELKWIDGPHLNQKSRFQISFWRADDSSMTPISPNASVKIYSWMIMSNGHNHGGPSMTTTEIAPGIFNINDARFFMHGMDGYWEIRVELLSNQEITEMAAYKVDFGR